MKRTKPIVTDIKDFDDDYKCCNSCGEKNFRLNFYNVKFMQTVITLCQQCANSLCGDLSNVAEQSLSRSGVA